MPSAMREQWTLLRIANIFHALVLCTAITPPGWRELCWHHRRTDNVYDWRRTCDMDIPYTVAWPVGRLDTWLLGWHIGSVGRINEYRERQVAQVPFDQWLDLCPLQAAHPCCQAGHGQTGDPFVLDALPQAA